MHDYELIERLATAPAVGSRPVPVWMLVEWYDMLVEIKIDPRFVWQPGDEIGSCHPIRFNNSKLAGAIRRALNYARK